MENVLYATWLPVLVLAIAVVIREYLLKKVIAVYQQRATRSEEIFTDIISGEYRVDWRGGRDPATYYLLDTLSVRGLKSIMSAVLTDEHGGIYDRLTVTLKSGELALFRVVPLHDTGNYFLVLEAEQQVAPLYESVVSSYSDLWTSKRLSTDVQLDSGLVYTSGSTYLVTDGTCLELTLRGYN